MSAAAAESSKAGAKSEQVSKLKKEVCDYIYVCIYVTIQVCL